MRLTAAKCTPWRQACTRICTRSKEAAPVHRITAFVRRVTMSSSRAVPALTARRLCALFLRPRAPVGSLGSSPSSQMPTAIGVRASRGLRSLDAARQPPRTPGRQVGAPLNQRPYILEEAGAVGAQILRDELAGKLRLTCRRAFRMLLGVQKSLPTICGNCG
jgi:hypothetical protein